MLLATRYVQLLWLLLFFWHSFLLSCTLNVIASFFFYIPFFLYFLFLFTYSPVRIIILLLFFFSKLTCFIFYFIFIIGKRRSIAWRSMVQVLRGHLFYCLINALIAIQVGHRVYNLFYFFTEAVWFTSFTRNRVHKLIRMSIISRLSSRDNHTLFSFAGFIPLAW